MRNNQMDDGWEDCVDEAEFVADLNESNDRDDEHRDVLQAWEDSHDELSQYN